MFGVLLKTNRSLVEVTQRHCSANDRVFETMRFPKHRGGAALAFARIRIKSHKADGNCS
jgi:hypothetical protein